MASATNGTTMHICLDCTRIFPSLAALSKHRHDRLDSRLVCVYCRAVTCDNLALARHRLSGKCSQTQVTLQKPAPASSSRQAEAPPPAQAEASQTQTTSQNPAPATTSKQAEAFPPAKAKAPSSTQAKAASSTQAKAFSSEQAKASWKADLSSVIDRLKGLNLGIRDEHHDKPATAALPTTPQEKDNSTNGQQDRDSGGDTASSTTFAQSCLSADPSPSFKTALSVEVQDEVPQPATTTQQEHKAFSVDDFLQSEQFKQILEATVARSLATVNITTNKEIVRAVADATTTTNKEIARAVADAATTTNKEIARAVADAASITNKETARAVADAAFKLAASHAAAKTPVVVPLVDLGESSDRATQERLLKATQATQKPPAAANITSGKENARPAASIPDQRPLIVASVARDALKTYENVPLVRRDAPTVNANVPPILQTIPAASTNLVQQKSIAQCPGCYSIFGSWLSVFYHLESDCCSGSISCYDVQNLALTKQSHKIRGTNELFTCPACQYEFPLLSAMMDHASSSSLCSITLASYIDKLQWNLIAHLNRL